MADDLKDVIRENAEGPSEVSGDEGSVKQHSLQDQIAADKHLGNKEAVRAPNRGLRFNKLSPPGSA